jgi:hypothetical protein
MSSSHLCLGLSCGHFPSDSPTKILHPFLISPTHHISANKEGFGVHDGNNTPNILVGNLKRKDNLEELALDGRSLVHKVKKRRVSCRQICNLCTELWEASSKGWLRGLVHYFWRLLGRSFGAENVNNFFQIRHRVRVKRFSFLFFLLVLLHAVTGGPALRFRGSKNSWSAVIKLGQSYR